MTIIDLRQSYDVLNSCWKEPEMLKEQAQTSKEGLVIARLQMKLQRLCTQLVAQGKIKAVYSFHDLRRAFAERNAAKGLRWLQRRLGHSAIAITEKYLRNTLALDAEKL